MEYKHIQIYFFLALLTGMLFLSALLFLPYLGALVFAAMLGVMFHPLYQRLAHYTKEGVAALMTIIVILIIVLLPLVIFGALVIEEARGVYAALNSPNETVGVFSFIESAINKVMPTDGPLAVTVDVNSYIKQIVGSLIGNFGRLFSEIAGITLSIFISIFALYYFFKDGAKLKRSIIALSPLADTDDEQIFRKLTIAVNTVMRGAILIAVVQGILSGIGYFIFGVPNPALWGAVTVIAALVPAIGTAVVMIPVLIYLFASGNMFGFFGLLFWGGAIVGMVDNVLRPMLIERGIHIHPLFILLSVLGGLSLFGPIGFLLGPLVVSFLFTLIDIYKEEFKEYIHAGF